MKASPDSDLRESPGRTGWRRRSTSLVAVLLGLALLTSWQTMASAQEVEPPSEQAQSTFAEIAGCLAASDELRVIMVVDESRSLRQTDPDSQRTSAILSTLDSLSLLQQGYPDKTIAVAAATFADRYTGRIGWGPASGSHLDELRSFATDDVPNLNTGTATDYRAAMVGAQQDLLADPAPACKVMLWFTDGGLDVGDSSTATAAALQEICTLGGIADSLRSGEIMSSPGPCSGRTRTSSMTRIAQPWPRSPRAKPRAAAAARSRCRSGMPTALMCPLATRANSRRYSLRSWLGSPVLLPPSRCNAPANSASTASSLSRLTLESPG